MTLCHILPKWKGWSISISVENYVVCRNYQSTVYNYIFIFYRYWDQYSDIKTNSDNVLIVIRVFANVPGDLGSIPGRVIPKTQKMVLDASLLNTQHYKIRIKGKWSNPGKGEAPSPTPWCSRYRKGSLRVTLNYGCQLNFTYKAIIVY